MYKRILILVLFILFIESCRLYEKDERILATYVRVNGTKVSIYYVDMGATTKEVIQVRVSRSSQNDSVIKNFERNYLQSSKLLNDTSLFLVLRDSGSMRQDTSILRITTRQ